MALTQISTAGVKDDAVTSGKIPANAVGSSELADNAVDTAAIADGAVTAGKLASGVQTTINNNADNRVITGSGTANTLEGESNLKFDGSRLGINDPNFANYNADCDDIIIQGSGNTGITINSGGTGNSFTGNIAFAEGNGTGGSADAFRGAISYKHNDDYMTFYTDYNERMRIDSSGKILTPLGTTTRIGVADRTSGTGAGGSLLVTAGAARGSGQTTGDLLLASGRGNNSASAGEIKFGYSDGSDGTGLDSEWMRIDSSGIVRIGDTTAGYENNDSRVNIIKAASGGTENPLLTLWNPTTAADARAGLDFLTNAQSGTGRDGAFIRGSNDGATAQANIQFGTISNETYTEKIRFQTGGGISFNGDTAAANALDDYEEGTWTPQIGGSNASKNHANYVKIGRFVHLDFDITNNSGSAHTSITNLPFTAVEYSAWHVAWVSNSSGGSLASSDLIGGLVSANTLSARGAGGNTNININNNVRMIGSATYQTAT
jgi:hypothetical protein